MSYFLRITDDFEPAWAAGLARGPIIFIRPKYKDDTGLLAHETVHRWQWILTLGLHSLLYQYVASYRLWAEVQAYREQLKHCSEDRSWLFAGFISTRYRLKISQADAHALLIHQREQGV